MVEHLVTMKTSIDGVITEVFYSILVRSLSSIGVALTAILFATSNYRASMVYPVVAGESATILLMAVLAVPKWRSANTKLIDAIKLIEAALLIAICLVPQYAVMVLSVYILVSLVYWRITFFNLLNAINETFLLRLVLLSYFR